MTIAHITLALLAPPRIPPVDTKNKDPVIVKSCICIYETWGMETEKEFSVRALMGEGGKGTSANGLLQSSCVAIIAMGMNAFCFRKHPWELSARLPLTLLQFIILGCLREQAMEHGEEGRWFNIGCRGTLCSRDYALCYQAPYQLCLISHEFQDLILHLPSSCLVQMICNIVLLHSFSCAISAGGLYLLIKHIIPGTFYSPSDK